MGNAVGLDGLVGVAEMSACIGRPAGTGDAGYGIGNHKVARNEACFERRHRSKRRRRRIAARSSHQHGLAAFTLLGELCKVFAR